MNSGACVQLSVREVTPTAYPYGEPTGDLPAALYHLAGRPQRVRFSGAPRSETEAPVSLIEIYLPGQPLDSRRPGDLA
jgi:hypothetical protein